MKTETPEKVSPRDAILRERAAFMAGIRWLAGALHRVYPEATVATLAEDRYPIPVVTRPREVEIEYTTGGKAAFRYVDGKLESRIVSRGQRPYSPPPMYSRTAFNPATWTPEGIMAIAELIERPFETVEIE